jgi:hypothetical protein
VKLEKTCFKLEKACLKLEKARLKLEKAKLKLEKATYKSHRGTSQDQRRYTSASQRCRVQHTHLKGRFANIGLRPCVEEHAYKVTMFPYTTGCQISTNWYEYTPSKVTEKLHLSQ